MKLRIFLSSVIFTALVLSGCKSSPPQVAGKWQGSSTLSTTYTPPAGGASRTEQTPVGVSFLLTQNGQTLQGNATVKAGANTIDVPITTGVVTQDGKLSLEGEKSVLLTKAHFSFDGKAQSGKIAGTLHLALGNVRGGADNQGSVTLMPAS